MTKSGRGSRHVFLREATAEVHEDLEAVIEGRAYLTALQTYGQYLQRLHAFHQDFSGALRDGCEELADAWGLDTHESRLELDLGALGLSPLETTEGQINAPRIDDRASAYGAAYVVFGSALGARILIKRVEALKLPEGRGLSYLASLSTKGEWPQFLAGLESEPDLSEPELLRGALETFQSYKDHMTRSIL